ncbi:MAG: hypothetical protein QM482_03995 [Sulfurospirillum sp.]
MIKTFLIVFLLVVSSESIEIKCKGCSAGKDMVKCDYYVVKQHNLTYQRSCLAYAQYIDMDGMYAKAAWYYLLGGDKQKAKKSATKALREGYHYAAEYKGFADLLVGNQKEAQKALIFFRNKVKNIDYAKRDIEIMKYIYINFDSKSVDKILYR